MILFAASFGLLLGVAMGSSTEPEGTLLVRVTNVQELRGTLYVYLFRPGDNLFKEPWRAEHCPVTNLESEFRFQHLAYGTYVAFAFQDLNGNGRLDHNWLHLPAEPLGYSNQWNFGLLTGLPTFEKAHFSFSPSESSVSILLK